MPTPLKPTLFPVHRFAGSHRAIGRAYGETCRDRVREHLDLAMQRIAARRGWDAMAATDQALAYRPLIVAHAAFFDDEVQGLAEGAGIGLGQAYLLQLRAELNPSRPVAAAEEMQNAECTTLAVNGLASADGAVYAGQVADLPLMYAGLGVIVEFAPTDQPAVLMFTPAGQLSYIGVNDRGVACFGNYLQCDGWRLGVPRYFLSRIALTRDTVAGALDAIRAVPRASSRNLMLADARGAIIDLETTVDDDAELAPHSGVLAHANHYASPALAAHERSRDTYLFNSRQRHARMHALLHEGVGGHDLSGLQAIARDRHGAPHCISRSPHEGGSGSMSIAAVIASLTRRRLWVADGPPHAHEFVEVGFSLGAAH